MDLYAVLDYQILTGYRKSFASGMNIELNGSGESFTVPYSEFVGVSLYLEKTVRPHISFAVGIWLVTVLILTVPIELSLRGRYGI